MRVVLDTNALVSGALAIPGSPAATILDAWHDAVFTLVVSDDILDELTRVLAKPYFAARLTPQDTAAFLELLRESATRVAVAGDFLVSPRTQKMTGFWKPRLQVIAPTWLLVTSNCKGSRTLPVS